MKLIHPPPELARAGLGALKAVATAGGPLTPAARNLMGAAQRYFFGGALDLEALAPIEPAALASFPPDPALRRQLVQGLVLMSLTDGPPPPAKVAVVEAFAKALGVEAEEVTHVRRLADRDMLLFRLDFLRKGHIADMVGQQYEATGLLGTVKSLLGLRGVGEDKELSARYRALGELPEGTLGEAFFHHYDSHGYSFPGEKHGFPEAGVYHDFAHVLSGYGVDPAGEMCIGAFVAGFKKQNPFYVLLFVTLTFSAATNVTPIPQPVMQGVFAEAGLADEVFLALDRGAAMNVDLSDHWDHWPWVDKPLDEVRRAFNVV